MPDRAITRGARAGIFGKLPARGDFVRENLPRGFTDPWDAWWQRGLADTRERAGEAWVASWLEAPVWRFLLPPGLCGGEGVVGIWLPSVDKAGRYYPLTLAATAPFDWATQPWSMAGFLAALEQAGRDALDHDLAPDALANRAADALAGCEDAPLPALRRESPWPEAEAGQAVLWSEGGPRVGARILTGSSLPEGSGFAAMIDDDWAAWRHADTESPP